MSILPDLSEDEGLEIQTLELEPGSPCHHVFKMKGLTVIECIQCGFGLTGLTVKQAEKFCKKQF